MLIRKVFGGFNLFCFPDVDSRPAKRGLQKKKSNVFQEKTQCWGDSCIPDPVEGGYCGP